MPVRVIWTPQITLQPVSSSYPCSPLPSSTHQTAGRSIPWCCLPTFSFIRLSFVLSFPFPMCPARWSLTKTDEQEIWPLHCSLHVFTIFRRSLWVCPAFCIQHLQYNDHPDLCSLPKSQCPQTLPGSLKNTWCPPSHWAILPKGVQQAEETL